MIHATLVEILKPLALQILNPSYPRKVSVGISGFHEAKVDDEYAARILGVFNAARATSGEPLDVDAFHSAVGRETLRGQPDRRAWRLTEAVVQGVRGFPSLDAWALFLTLLRSQDEFTQTFSGTGSQEERLTGHFLSSIFSASNVVSPLLAETLSFEKHRVLQTRVAIAAAGWSGSIQVAYGDIAAKNMEKHTGGDFGLILIRPRGEGLTFRPFRFQAKKSQSRGGSDITYRHDNPEGQLNNLLESKIGYYVYYHKGSRENGCILPPLVQPAEAIRTYRMDITKVRTFTESLDFATFFLSKYIEPERSAFEFDTMVEAIEALWDHEGDPPSSIMALATCDPKKLILRPLLQSSIDVVMNRHPSLTIPAASNGTPSAHQSESRTDQDRDDEFKL